MKKDLTICFRTTRDIRNALEELARESRKSLSSVIDNIIYHYLKVNKSLKEIQNERREFSRKTVQFPAFIHTADVKTNEIKTGTVLNISLSGLLISVPKESKLEITTNGKDKKFQVIFTLPGSLQPIEVVCRSQRVYRTEEDVQVGVDFVDSNFQSCQNLQRYLM
ncbi:MAG: PilZ domain-containing protein [Syntrophales bacterium]|jgi:hypothetical protein